MSVRESIDLSLVLTAWLVICYILQVIPKCHRNAWSNSIMIYVCMCVHTCSHELTCRYVLWGNYFEGNIDNFDKVQYVYLKWNYIILYMGRFLNHFCFEINNSIVSFKISNCFSIDMLHNCIVNLKSWNRLIESFFFPPLLRLQANHS